MRNIFISSVILLLSSITALGQLQIGYVDSEAIMSQLPDAQDAQKRIDTQIEEWQKEKNKNKTN